MEMTASFVWGPVEWKGGKIPPVEMFWVPSQGIWVGGMMLFMQMV